MMEVNKRVYKFDKGLIKWIYIYYLTLFVSLK